MWSAAPRMLMASVVSLVAVACSDDPSTLGGKHTSTSSGATSTSGATSGGTSGGASTSGGTSGATSSSSGESPADVCVAAINQHRATKGLAPYARWNDAETCTDGESQSDATTLRAHGAFGKCGEFAQNECPGWPAPAGTMIPSCLKAMWAEGPGGGHYEAMSSTQYTKVACGFGTAKDGSIWAAQNFR